VTARRGVAILEASHGKELLGDGGSDDAGTTGSGDKSHANRAALARDLAGDGVGLSSVETPISSADRHEVHLGVDDSTTDSSGNFLASLAA